MNTTNTINRINRIRRKHSSTKSTTRKLPKSTTLHIKGSSSALYNTSGPSNWPSVGKPTMYSPMSAIPTPQYITNWGESVRKIYSMPVFYISCHGSIDLSMPTFKIPESVFILNATSGGEYCLGGDAFDNAIYEHYNQFHKLLVVDDIHDIPTISSNELFKYQSVVKQYYINDLGVYSIMKNSFKPSEDLTLPFENSNSFIKPTEINPKTGTKDWFLEDIIHKIQSKNAIYIFAGCTVGFWNEKNLKIPSKYKNIEKTTDFVQTMIYQADTAYSSQVLTMPLESLISYNAPINTGGPKLSRPSVSTVVTMARALGAPLHTVASKYGDLHIREYKTAGNILKKYKNMNTS